MTKPPLTLQMPSPPDPVPVVLNPATTALLIFDIVDPICTRQPNCTGHMVPAISSLLARARKAGVTVAFGTRAPTMSNWLPEVSPALGDIKIESQAQDRFYNTDLDQTLKAKGITTLILAGWLESERIGDLHVGRSNAARLYDRCSYRREFGRHGLRNCHRAVPDFASAQCERLQRGLKG